MVTPRWVGAAGLGQNHLLAVLAVRAAPLRMGGHACGPPTRRARQTRTVRHHLIARAVALGTVLADFLHQILRGAFNHGHARGVAKCAELTFGMYLPLRRQAVAKLKCVRQSLPTVHAFDHTLIVGVVGPQAQLVRRKTMLVRK